METDRLSPQQATTAILIPIALAVGLVLFMAVVTMLPMAPLLKPAPAAPGNVVDETPPILTVVAIAVAILNLGVAIVIASLFVKHSIQQAAKESPKSDQARWDQAFQCYFQQHLVRLALVEGGAMFLVVAYLLEGQMFTLILATVFTGIIIFQIPTRASIVTWISRFLEHVAAIRGEGGGYEPA